MRGQAHTVEGIVGGLIVLSGLWFALQMTAVTPLTASVAHQHLGEQTEATAQGVLAAAADRGDLRSALLYWNATTEGFHGAGDGFYTAGGPPNAFGHLLNETFAPRGVAFNVNLLYRTGDGGRAIRRLVYTGHPNDDAVVATRLVTLYDHDHLRDAGGNRTSRVLGDASYFAPDVAPGEHVYNVVEIEVVLWRA